MSEIRNLTRNGETFYPLTTSSAVINEATGEGLVIDDDPTENSDNLVKSGGVYDVVEPIMEKPSQSWVNLTPTWVPVEGEYWISANIDVSSYIGRKIMVFFGGYSGNRRFHFYDANNELIEYIGSDEAVIPYGTSYVVVKIQQTFKDDAKVVLSNEQGTASIGDRVSYLNSVAPTNTWLIGDDYLVSGGVNITYATGFALKPKKYNRIKYRTTRSRSTLVFYLYLFIDSVGVYLSQSFQITNIINDGKVHEMPINLDLSYLSRDAYISMSNVFMLPDRLGNLPFITNIDSLLGSSTDSILTHNNNMFSGIDFSYVEEYVDSKINPDGIYNHFFKNKKYVSYGDSITADNSGSGNYPHNISHHFGMKLVNKAVHGSRCINNLTDANLAVIDTDTMLVTISGGENGWTSSEDINTLDRTTDVGAINYAIDYIRSIQPKCVIVLCPTYKTNSTFIADYIRIADNKHVGLAPTTDLRLIDWEGDMTPKVIRYDNVHLSNYGGTRFAAVCINYISNFINI